MNDINLFTVNFITPLKVFERQVVSLRLRDGSGYFGIMKNHADCMTVLVPSLGFFRDGNDKEVFLALNGGALTVKSSRVTVMSREITESEDADALSSVLQNEILKRDRYELSFRDMLGGIERAFWEKKIKAEKRGR
jgi:F-type H+-transporting ATPase subunit epsilon